MSVSIRLAMCLASCSCWGPCRVITDGCMSREERARLHTQMGWRREGDWADSMVAAGTMVSFKVRWCYCPMGGRVPVEPYCRRGIDVEYIRRGSWTTPRVGPWPFRVMDETRATCPRHAISTTRMPGDQWWPSLFWHPKTPFALRAIYWAEGTKLVSRGAQNQVPMRT